MNNINGLENVRIIRPGYAIEYDYIDPRELFLTLETKKIKNLDITWKLSAKENKILDVEIEKISLIKTQKLEMRPLLKKNKNNFSQFIKIYFSN